MADNIHTIQARLTQLAKTEEEWETTYVDYKPLKGEIVIYTSVDGVPGKTDIKVGDGENIVGNLKFAGGAAVSGQDSQGNYILVGDSKLTEQELLSFKLTGTVPHDIGGIEQGRKYIDAQLGSVISDLLFTSSWPSVVPLQPGATGKQNVQQIADGVQNGIKFSGENPRAEALDSTLSNDQSYGAVGDFSHSEGGKSSAQGKRSHAEGTTTIAKGGYSHAEGNNSVSYGSNSHAEGQKTTAYGSNAHSEGFITLSQGNHSHAEGNNTTAIGDNSHAEGFETVAGQSNTAGHSAHAEGIGAKATGNGAHAEGGKTQATNMHAHAEGFETVASGQNSHAEGNGARAFGHNSHAEGYQTIADGENSHTEGWDTATSYIGAHQHAEGSRTLAASNCAHAEGRGSSTDTGALSMAVLGGKTVSDIHVQWQMHKDFTAAIGPGSHAEGVSTLASGSGAHAEGTVTQATHNYSHAGGLGTKTSAEGQTVVGSYNVNEPTAKFIVGIGELGANANGFSAGRENGEAYIKIGGTKISEKQLQQLLALLAE